MHLVFWLNYRIGKNCQRMRFTIYTAIACLNITILKNTANWTKRLFLLPATMHELREMFNKPLMHYTPLPKGHTQQYIHHEWNPNRSRSYIVYICKETAYMVISVVTYLSVQYQVLQVLGWASTTWAQVLGPLSMNTFKVCQVFLYTSTRSNSRVPGTYISNLYSSTKYEYHQNDTRVVLEYQVIKMKSLLRPSDGT